FPTVALSLDIPSVNIQELELKQAELPDKKPELSASNVKKKIMDVVKKASKNKTSLAKSEKKKLKEETEISLSRVKRQGGNFPIPTIRGFYTGPDDPRDGCGRNNVQVGDKGCYQVMSQGPCELDELVLVNVTTREGYCGPRLCGPDRVFLFGDQLCHDPREPGICPSGRILYTSHFGTPVCGCPDGTYEREFGVNNEDCQLILTNIDSCPADEVFWFKTFSQPPLCRRDPCDGLNLNRSTDELPFINSLRDGKCYQIGSQPKICRSDQFYSLDMVKLKGVCERLDDAGYTILNAQDVSTIASLFGKPLDKDTTPAFPKDTTPAFTGFPKPSTQTVGSADKSPSKNKKRPLTPASTTLIQRPVIGSPVMPPVHSANVIAPLRIGASVVPPLSPIHNLIPAHPLAKVLSQVSPAHSHPNALNLVPTHMNAWSPQFITVDGSVNFINVSGMTAQPVQSHHLGRRSPQSPQSHHRQRRNPQPFATPGNVFEPGLTSCRAGASKDLNAKCRNVVLPSRYPPSRPRRTAPALRPRTSCRGGSIFGVDRRCRDRSTVSSRVNSFGLGR
ncbi:unnamed protein product, partial [Meganyctiphanes norvegica]